MDIFINNKSDIPLHKQIYDKIKRGILTGELKEGEPLPTVRGLAKDLRISIITTARAYKDLEQDGFIDTVVGKGSFVARLSDGLQREEYLKEAEKFMSKAAEKAACGGMSKEEFVRLAEEFYGGKYE